MKHSTKLYGLSLRQDHWLQMVAQTKEKDQNWC